MKSKAQLQNGHGLMIEFNTAAGANWTLRTVDKLRILYNN
jgi:hypothetical protein